MNNQLLPPNATPQEVALSGATARVGAVPVPLKNTYNPATYPANLLPWLAWAYSVDEWNPEWSEAQRRESTGGSYYVHRHKGTIGALRTALGALGYDISILEWFNKTPTAGPAYTFGLTVTVDQIGIPSAALYDQIVYVANSAKNVRSKLTGVDVLGKRAGDIYFGGVAVCGETITIASEP